MALDIRSIEAVTTELARLQAEDERKTRTISSLASERTTLLNEKRELADRLAVAEEGVSKARAEALTLREQRDQLAAENQRLGREAEASISIAATREKELSEIRSRHAELLARGSSDQALVSELSHLRLENEFQRNELLARNRMTQQVMLELELSRAEGLREQNARESLEKQLAGEQARRSELERELAATQGRTEFNAADLSEYLNDAIDTFNNQTNGSDSSINYIISEMQVDLKAGIGTAPGTGLTMVAPPQSQLSDQGLSSFKFTIRAVPNAIEPN